MNSLIRGPPGPRAALVVDQDSLDIAGSPWSPGSTNMTIDGLIDCFSAIINDPRFGTLNQVHRVRNPGLMLKIEK